MTPTVTSDFSLLRRFPADLGPVPFPAAPPGGARFPARAQKCGPPPFREKADRAKESELPMISSQVGTFEKATAD